MERLRRLLDAFALLFALFLCAGSWLVVLFDSIRNGAIGMFVALILLIILQPWRHLTKP